MVVCYSPVNSTQENHYVFSGVEIFAHIAEIICTTFSCISCVFLGGVVGLGSLLSLFHSSTDIIVCSYMHRRQKYIWKLSRFFNSFSEVSKNALCKHFTDTMPKIVEGKIWPIEQ